MPYKVVFILLVLLVGCQNNESVKKDKPQKQALQPKEDNEKQSEQNQSKIGALIKGADSVLLSKKKVVEKWDKQWSVVSYEFYEESGPGKLVKWQQAINDFIRKSLYHPFDSKPYTGPLNKALIKRSLENFKKEAKRYDEDELNMVWNMGESYEINATRNDFVTLVHTSNIYEGGAHGSYGIGNYHFDKSTGKELRFNDFFKKEKGLLFLAETAFRKAVGITSTVAFNETDFWFEKGFFCPDNFLFTKDRVTFYYNQYEVAPYSFGTITFSMPLRQIKPYLKREI